MDETTMLREGARVPRSRSNQQVDLVDDECSTDSGCSSGGSTGSAEVLSRRGSAERPHYRSRGRSSCGTATGHHQERLKQRKAAGVLFETGCKSSSRSWSPDEKARFRPACRSILKSPSHSRSPSDAPSSDSDSLKRSSTTRSLRKAFQSLKITTTTTAGTTTTLENEKTASNGGGEKKTKCQKRILRSPVAYTYVKGLSGLPTQRIPRNAV